VTAPGLDNPFWTCLATRHSHFALGGPLARRYPCDISPIAGMSGATPVHVAALETLVDVDDDIGLVGPHVPVLSSRWQTLHASELTQMLRTDPSPLPETDADVSALAAADVPEMLALVERTQPGPFRKRTIELGCFWGIRRGGRLVAMAGERTWIGDFREVSGVCTDPEAQGRGHARTLIARVVNRMLHAGEMPFLHVESANTRAIDLYRGLGFVRRTRFPLLAAKRID
jgi:predicted GNAT family acetyltransferase